MDHCFDSDPKPPSQKIRYRTRGANQNSNEVRLYLTVQLFVTCLPFSFKVRECVQYHNLRERSRNINYGALVGTKCDNSGILTAGAWYRFTDSAGTRMLDRCPTTKCDTAFQGWLRGGQPGYGQVKVTRTVCYQGNSNCCNWPVNIRVTHCKYFIVYQLKPVGGCNLRHCGTF